MGEHGSKRTTPKGRESDRQQPKRGGIASLDSVLGAYLRSSGLDAHFASARVFKAWRDAVGPALAARAKAVRFQGGVLEVAVSSAAHLQELTSFTGENYRRAANRKLGDERIQRVEFRLQR